MYHHEYIFEIIFHDIQILRLRLLKRYLKFINFFFFLNVSIVMLFNLKNIILNFKIFYQLTKKN